MESPQRISNVQNDSSFYFDPTSLTSALEDPSGVTPKQARSNVDFWTEDDEVTIQSSQGRSAHGTGRHFQKKANPLFEYWDNTQGDFASPDQQGVPSVAGLSTGGTTNSRVMPQNKEDGSSPQVSAECQLVLDDSSEGSEVECPIDIDALVKVTPNDAKKAEPTFYGLQLSNNGRLNMDEPCDDEYVPPPPATGYTNNGRSAPSAPTPSGMGYDIKIGDSPAKLTASELRRLARQQVGPLATLNSNTMGSPSAVVVETGTGRRMPVSAGAPVIACVAQSARPASMSHLPGHAVEVMQPTSRRGAPQTTTIVQSISSGRPRPASTCSAGTSTSPTMSGSARTNPHNLSSDSGGASGASATMPSQRSVVPMAPSHASPANTSGLVTAVIEFKAGRRMRCRCPIAVAEKCRASLGSIYVIMQSDNGTIDAGVCSKIYNQMEKGLIPRTLGSIDQGTVLRIATDEDCDFINTTLPELEELAMRECHILIQHMQLPLECVDVEVTFDQTALKIFYSVTGRSIANHSPSIGRLQRELSAKLHLRVTLERCNGAEEEISTMTLAPSVPSNGATAPVTVTMRAHHGIAPSATASLALPAPTTVGGPVVQTSTRRIPSNYIVTQSTLGASAFTAAIVTPPSLGNSTSATRAPSAAVSSLNASPSVLETASVMAVFSSEPPSRDGSSFVVTSLSQNGSPYSKGCLPHQNLIGVNAFAAPWAPSPEVPQTHASPMPVASSRRTVPTTFITNVQATSDNITYNGTYAVGSHSGTPIPTPCHQVQPSTTRPSSSTVHLHQPTMPMTSSTSNLRSATFSHMKPRSGVHTPSTAVSRTPSVVSVASPSEASENDYPVASSRRRIYRP